VSERPRSLRSLGLRTFFRDLLALRRDRIEDLGGSVSILGKSPDRQGKIVRRSITSEFFALRRNSFKEW